MRFYETDKLKPGMRLAKPIYNKDGVLLYERGSALSSPAIFSVKNFGLIGLYILEPAEPLPPFSKEDREFEQLQTMYMFKLRDCIHMIDTHKKPEQLYSLAEDIINHYGVLNHRVNFNQNLRSIEDFMYKHAISTAILAAMMTSRLHYNFQKQMTVVSAALLYSIGYRQVPKRIIKKGMNLSEKDSDIVEHALITGIEPLGSLQNEYSFFARTLALMQTFIYSHHPESLNAKPDRDLMIMLQLLRIAAHFDRMTAMNLGHEPVSEISAMISFSKEPKLYNPDITAILAECIHIVPQAASVDLSNGDKGIVLVENPRNFMRPVILSLGSNRIYDLSKSTIHRNIQIVDIMKTMDNRVEMDEATLKQFVPDEKLTELTRQFQKAFSDSESVSETE